MEGGPAKRARVEENGNIGRFWPLSAPMGWCYHGISAPADFIAAIRFPATHYPAFGRTLGEHKLHDAVLQAQSVLLLYLQAVLSVKPAAACVCYAHSDANAAAANEGREIHPSVCPVDVVVLAPLTFEQVNDVLTKLESLTGPPPLDERGRPVRRRPIEFGAKADFRRVSNLRTLFLGSEQLSGRPVQKSDDVLAKPSVDRSLDDISDTIANHFLSLCDARKVLPSWAASAEQRKTDNYYEAAADGGFLFRPKPILDELGLRTLGPNEQIKLLYSGSEPNANKWLDYAMPHRAASDKKLRELVTTALMLKAIDPKVMAGTPTKGFITNAYTVGESARIGSQSLVLTKIADPQLNTPISHTLDISFEATASMNDEITFANYPMLRHTQLMLAKVLEDTEGPELKATAFCDLYRSAVLSFESGGGAGFPAALYEMMQEHNAFVEAGLAGEEDGYVRQLWSFRGTHLPLGGYDTLGTLISQFYHLGMRAMNLMSTQISSWLVLITSILGGALRNTNKKLRFALIGTAMSGKSHVGGAVLNNIPKTLKVIEGDDSQLVKMYMGNQHAFKVAFKDEIPFQGADQKSKDQEHTRGFRGALTAMEDGYIKSRTVMPGKREDGSSFIGVEEHMQDMRMMEMICFNTMVASKAYRTRMFKLMFKDPSKRDAKRVKIAGQSNKVEAELAGRLLRMVGFSQMITSFPSHFGLDKVGPNTQLLYVFCSLIESVGGIISDFGRDLAHIEEQCINTMHLRVAAEAQRFHCVRPGTLERPTAPEMALQCMLNNVCSPADVLAAYGSVKSCGFTTHQILNALVEALIALFQHSMQKSADNDNKLTFTGFELIGGHFVLQPMGAGRRTADDIDVLADRVHSIVSTLMPTSSPSAPDVKSGLENLTQRFINGSASLTTKTWTDPNDTNDKGTVRWALSKDLIQKVKLDRVRALMLGLSQLVSIISRVKGQPYVSIDEEHWIIPLEGYGDVAMNPVEHKANPDRNLKNVAGTILLPPDIATHDSNAKNHMLSERQADQYFRLAEQLDLVSVEVFNSGKAYIAVERENTTGPRSLKDPTKGLQEVSLTRGYISINIAQCKEYTEMGGNGIDKMVEVAQAFLAITLPPASFVNPHRIFMGLRTRMETGMVELDSVPLFDPTGFKVRTDDWLYRDSILEEDLYIGPAPQRTANVMPGFARTVTYKFGDALYEQLLKAHAENHGMPGTYTTYYHIPGWNPCQPGSAAAPAAT